MPLQKPIFENRRDAGRQLAARLAEYKQGRVVILAIPNGGVPIAYEVATALEADLDLVVSRKIPLPLSPEGGCGAVTDDGTIILNDEAVKQAGLSQEQINSQVDQVRASIRQRSLLYHRDRPLSVIRGKTAIIVDDGLASGYTMIAAVESVRHRRPEKVIVAVPVASEAALRQLEKTADKVITCAVAAIPKFYLADFYRRWDEPGDDEVMRCLDQLQEQRFSPGKPALKTAIDPARPYRHPRLAPGR